MKRLFAIAALAASLAMPAIAHAQAAGFATLGSAGNPLNALLGILTGNSTANPLDSLGGRPMPRPVVNEPGRTVTVYGNSVIYEWRNDNGRWSEAVFNGANQTGGLSNPAFGRDSAFANAFRRAQLDNMQGANYRVDMYVRIKDNGQVVLTQRTIRGQGRVASYDPYGRFTGSAVGSKPRPSVSADARDHRGGGNRRGNGGRRS